MKDDFETKCTYCWRNFDDLAKIPEHLGVSQRNAYCETCYPIVLKEAYNLPWNKNLHNNKRG